MHPVFYKGAHKTVILKITIMASVRRDWERNNGYLVKAGYPLFFAAAKSNRFIHSDYNKFGQESRIASPASFPSLA